MPISCEFLIIHEMNSNVSEFLLFHISFKYMSFICMGFYANGEHSSQLGSVKVTHKSLTNATRALSPTCSCISSHTV